MTIIKKKIWPENFELIVSGKKKAELRLADFDIAEGDTFILEEWDPATKSYTGRTIEKRVTNVKKFNLDDFGQAEEIKEKGLLIISIK